ncbi:MAG: PaaI family thioesterase [Bacteroidia bacterium]
MNFSNPNTYESRNPNFKELIADKLTRQHFMKLMGFELTKIEAGYIEGEAILEQKLKQQDGLVHGGVTSTVADIVTGFAAFSMVHKDDRVVTSNLNVSYFAPGRGEKIFARGWVTKPGSRLHYCEGEVYVVRNGEHHLIAKANSIMAVIQGKNKQVEGEQ